MLYGTPRRSDGLQSPNWKPSTHWTQPLYACTTGISASVKQVAFVINATASLSNLQVTDVQNKPYKDNASIPTWGLEDTGQQIGDTPPLWGLVNDTYENATGLWTQRTEKFWLPPTSSLLSLAVYYDSLAGVHIFGAIVNDMQTIVSKSGVFTSGDYTGGANFAMFRLWRDLSVQSSSASRIINLIFTDLLASATVGTKSAISSTGSSPTGGVAGPNKIEITVFSDQIQYNYPYGALAFLALAIWVASIAISIVLWARDRSLLTRMEQIINQTSTGRVLTSMINPSLWTTKSSEWRERAGSGRIALPLDKNDKCPENTVSSEGLLQSDIRTK